MMNINSFYGSTNAKGINGLATGIDTDLVVEQMLINSKNRIDREYQSQQNLVYKQEAYRDIGLKMLDFQSKYLSYSSNSSTNMLSSDFFKTSIIDSSSKYVSASGNIDNIKNIRIDNVESVASSASLVSTKKVANEIVESNIIEDVNSKEFSNKDNYIVFNYNGVNKKINMSSENVDAKSTAKYIQEELNKTFGENKISFSLNDNLNKFEFYTIRDTDIINISEVSYELNDITGLSTGSSNRLNLDKSLAQSNIESLDGVDGFKININGKDFSFTKDIKIKDIINQINSDEEAGVKISYSSISNNFSIISSGTGENSKIEISDIEGNLASSLFGKEGIDYNINAGTNSVLTYTLNGIQNTISRSTNSFDIDGVQINLNDNAATDTAITFSVIEDVEEVKNNIIEFVNDYNELIDSIHSRVTERPNRSYRPLTPEQESKLEEKEIEKWTKEAKKGVLYGDNLLNKALNKIRNAASSMIGEDRVSLSSIGITTTRGDYSGKLSINEEKLEKALQGDINKVKELFAGTENEDGIANKLSNVIRENVGISGATGILIREAGAESGLSTNNNNLSLRIKASDDRMSNLRNLLDKERERYYSKFTALEKMINTLNSQNSMFLNMFQN